jgi:hypothetical protein
MGYALSPTETLGPIPRRRAALADSHQAAHERTLYRPSKGTSVLVNVAYPGVFSSRYNMHA